MDSARSRSRPTTYRGTIRRYWRLLSLPIVLSVAAAGVYAFTHTKSYGARATLWVDTAAPTPSSVGAGGATLPTTPAAGEQTVLTELLATQSFAVAVADHSLLRPMLGNRASIELKAPSYLTSSQVGSVVAGPQVLNVSYSASSTALAKSTLQAIISQLIVDSNTLDESHDEAVISYYKSMLSAQSAALGQARAKADAYLTSHPHATVQTDPNYAALMARETAVSQEVAQTSSSLSQASGSRSNGGGSGWSVTVLDPPIARAFAMRKRKMAEILAGGLLGGVLVAFLAVIFLTPESAREPWEDELPTTVPSSASVPAQAAHGPSRAGMHSAAALHGSTLRITAEPTSDRASNGQAPTQS